jgi:hypothetical protein
MPDYVVDATVVHLANGDLAGRRPGNALDRRLTTIEIFTRDSSRLRYNPKLLGEYRKLIQEFRNDLIELFFGLLDSERAVFVKGNTLRKAQYDMAVHKCRWPSHDQHLLAAAIGGTRVTIFVTERRHICCGTAIYRHFGVRVVDLL